ncbi:hypothetical protein [uncultured Paludibaculum sp.]|uniref:phage fiber-tail adaptor protein n=1 Tax=uncultured Paludibaculum sp. TaxID=1765020 RepID=UPI002AAB2469|nr:hypothetical protein [uncultured Paludibaculum sp.]
MIEALRDEKDPQSTLDYFVDWSLWLGADTISASTWTVANGLRKVSDTHDGSTAVVWLQGGQPGMHYTVTNRIATAAGRTDERSFVVRVAQR